MTPATRVILLLSLFYVAVPALAQEIDFPELTGRVVDEADILDAGTERRLTALLKAHEDATTNQVVVVTLASLRGRTIEELGYRLGRHWAIGQEGKDNGVLLVVAPNEREVRIEVGYGLEGALTDATSRLIIENAILPAFRDGRLADGVEAGTQAILDVLGGGKPPGAAPSDAFPSVFGDSIFYILFLCIAFFVLGAPFLPLVLGGRHGGTWTSGGGWSGGGGGSGFSGGGGGFGGGGASGSW